MSVSEIDKKVLLLIRVSLYGINSLSDQERQQINDIRDWAPLVVEFKAHALLGILMPVLDEIQIGDNTVIETIRQMGFFIQVRGLQLLYAQNNVLNLMNLNNIPCVVIKGVAAGRYYPNPMLRSAGDVDLLVKTDNFQNAAAVLREHGYEIIHDDTEFDHHIVFCKDGICFELHRRPGGIDKTNHAHIFMFEDGIDNRKLENINHYTFPVMPEILNGSIILLHIKQHLPNGIGLRQVIDWMLFVDKNISDADWIANYADWFDSLGIKKFALILTAMCKQYLGLRKDIHWCDSADTSIAMELMDFIISSGNFGIKLSEQDKMASFFSKISNPIDLFFRLQKYGRIRQRSLGKNGLFSPFAWASQLLYIVKSLLQKRTDMTLISKSYVMGKRKRRLFKQLNLHDY